MSLLVAIQPRRLTTFATFHPLRRIFCIFYIISKTFLQDSKLFAGETSSILCKEHVGKLKFSLSQKFYDHRIFVLIFQYFAALYFTRRLFALSLKLVFLSSSYSYKKNCQTEYHKLLQNPLTRCESALTDMRRGGGVILKCVKTSLRGNLINFVVT